MDKKNKKEKQSRIGILEKTRSGSGFVRLEDGDVFIKSSNMHGAMHGDRVRVDLLPPSFWGKNPEGLVDRIVERGNPELIGTYHKGHKTGLLVPTDRKNPDTILIPVSASKGAKNGDSVVCTITTYPGKKNMAQGKVTEIIAKKNDTGGDIRTLVRAAGLKPKFPASCEMEASLLAKEKISDEEISLRRDLRDQTIITIDGADSKDLDDAVSCVRLPSGNFRLGVHIADVSHYVTPGSYLDKEALNRGNSVYLLTSVIPMLPKSLSNGICSLFEGVDRLTLSCEMEIDPNGNVIDHEIYESVICNKARMVYTDVSNLLENQDEDIMSRYADFYETLRIMEELAKILKEKRNRLGSIDFDFDEASIVLDEHEAPIFITVAERRVANRMIEEFMLVANQTVAEHFNEMETPFVYRVHDKCDPVKITDLKRFLANFNIDLRGQSDHIHPAELNRVLHMVAGKPEENLISTVLLRSMTKAYYSPECNGHFGLAFRDYCHFTSPIRRYPDLLDHRIIKAYLHGTPSRGQEKRFERAAEYAAEQSSQTERKAQELERDVEKLKKAQYMKNHIGEVFDGIISGVTGFGLYVQLPNTVEGLIPMSELTDDYYIFQEDKYRLIGEQKHRIFALGDPITIQVADANPEERQIDFLPAEMVTDFF